jgi:surfeit locus 1 family protein
MNLAGRRFAPAAWSVLLTAAGVALFVVLGLWQLERAEFKSHLQAKFEQRLTEDYRPLEVGADLEDIQYRKLRLEGSYVDGHHFLLDNQVNGGRAGYHVLTPFRLADGERVILVNRGWAPWGDSRTTLPAVREPAVAGMAAGIAFVPEPPALKLVELQLSGEWPELIPYIDLDALRGQYSPRLMPMILWLGPEIPGTYERAWDPIWLPPEKSRAYALQWFFFAGIALVLFVLLNLRKSE